MFLLNLYIGKNASRTVYAINLPLVEGLMCEPFSRFSRKCKDSTPKNHSPMIAL